LIGIEAAVSATEIEDNLEPSGKAIQIVIDAKNESGLLIGAHGATLNAIQFFIAMALRQRHDQWTRVTLDISNWRKKHEDYLQNLARQAAERARTTSQPQHLYNLSPAQRRVIHLFLSKEEGIVTESQGEGEGRYLVVKPA
jgi:spoIIIJ-associated protein